MSRLSRKPLDKDLYADVVAEAKERFDVWPSAYASGWVVKTYKARGGRYAGGDKKTRSGLTKWFGESWVDLSRPIHDEDGELVGYEPCGRKASDDPAAYPKCRPLKEAMRMSPSEVKDAIKRKRAAEAKAAKGRGGRGARAPVRVSTYRKNPDVTSTQEFRRWFGDSKVVDENGEPLVVYHGAPDVRGIFAGGFKRSSMRGDVFFATDDPRTAETYTDPHRAWDYQNAEPGVIPLYLRIENPLVVDAGFQHWRGTEHVIEQARQAGHDGVIIENTIDHYASDRKAKPRREDACTVFAFFSPTQVKSALTGPMKARDPNRWHVSTSQPLDFTGPNDGTFDLDDADLRSNPMREPGDVPGFRIAVLEHQKPGAFKGRIILAAYTDDGQMLAWIAALPASLRSETSTSSGPRAAAFPELRGYNDDAVVWEVAKSHAWVDGWGPLLYEALLAFVASKGYSGWVTSDAGMTSNEARAVWRRFSERDDVEFQHDVGKNVNGQPIDAMRALPALLAKRAPLLKKLDRRAAYTRAVKQFLRKGVDQGSGRFVAEDEARANPEAPTEGQTPGGLTWALEEGGEVPWKTDLEVNTFVRVTNRKGKTVCGIFADKHGDTLYVEYAEVLDPKLRGRGVYSDVLAGLSRHYNIVSDQDQNNVAAGIYRRLGAKYNSAYGRYTLQKKAE